jgi:two-component system, LytTR family, response regulator
MSVFAYIIVDDEIDACDYLRHKIKAVTNQLQVVGIGHSVSDALHLLQVHNPHLAFLDIEMYGQNMVEMLKKIPELKTKIILVTAYSQYAMPALRLQVHDYLLKPVDMAELRSAIHRFFLEEEKGNITWNSLAGEKYYHFKSNREDYYVHIKDIICLNGDRGYSDVFFQAAGACHWFKSSYPISHYEALLPTTVFIRVHKSAIVNRFHIRAIHANGGLYVAMTGNEKVLVSKRKEREFVGYLGGRGLK